MHYTKIKYIFIYIKFFYEKLFNISNNIGMNKIWKQTKLLGQMIDFIVV